MALSILAGAAVLIVEFVHKMEQVAFFALLDMQSPSRDMQPQPV